MSFYKNVKVLSTNIKDYSLDIENLNAILGNLSLKTSSMLKQFHNNTNMPIAVMEIIAKYSHKNPHESEWDTRRNSDTNASGYKNPLPAAFILDSMSNIFKLFNKLGSVGDLKIKDIKAFKYSIYAFNESSNNCLSLAKSQEDFDSNHSDLFYIELELKINNKIHDFGVLISIGGASSSCTAVSGANHSSVKRKELTSYWFPKIDEYFTVNESKNFGPNSKNFGIICDFVESCRKSVTERRNEL
ncbi:hypothetical protein AVV36_gp149 [Pectobacterium bacteriophage PM2]|uniref:Uncharacterized protein n=1 Tax=Pectobacterium bacteriophage PM2 TaxID=1429794 RepID=A0A0A0Q0G8_9CAUD|nr:hypothetical protein AVV36_gp149 [Pectobacterium bacteriophage PM2]AHY25111.1 hypothetical protein PM2_149 [Pectobacterium bacteriophage PM2]